MFLRHTNVLGIPVWHSARTGFIEMMKLALKDEPIAIGLGPIYQDDPGLDRLRPFMRSAQEAGYGQMRETDLAPSSILEMVREDRMRAIPDHLDNESELIDWARAALVLEMARLRGLHVSGRGVLHIDWRLNATVTGRFGAETKRGQGWVFNPLSMGEDDRRRVHASDAVRMVAVLDFKAMDVCSMRTLVPGLDEMLGDHPDPYTQIGDLTGLSRDAAKLSFLTWAYGGVVDPHVLDQLHRTFTTVVDFTRHLPHGVFPRTIQSISSSAFRAGLSRALPLLVHDDIIPMFTVHDELTLDVSDMGQDRLAGVIKALEQGASEITGRAYRVGARTGYTYEEAKNG